MERDLEHIVSKWSGRIRHRERRAEFTEAFTPVLMCRTNGGVMSDCIACGSHEMQKRCPYYEKATDINLLVLFSLMRRQT